MLNIVGSCVSSLTASVCWLVLMMLALTAGCQNSGDIKTAPETSSKPEAGTDKIQGADDLSSSSAASKTSVEPGSIAADGTVLLKPPKQVEGVTEAAKLDVIIEPLPPIPTNASFGEPTLAAALPTESTLTLEVPTVTKPEDSQVESIQPASQVGTLASAEELHQKIAADWPEPQAVLLLTGQQHGYMEPCGCTGLERQKGGIIRRDTLLSQLTERGWSVVPLDVGNQVRRTGRQAEIQFRTTANALKMMNYRGVTLGSDDLKLRGDNLLQVAGSDDVVKNPGIFVSSNTSLYDPTFWPKFQVFEAGGRKIGVTAYLGEELFKSDLSLNKDIVWEDPVPSLQSAVKELKVRGCDFIVLLAHSSQGDSEKVAAQVPGLDLVVTSGGHGEPRNILDPIEGSKAMISQVGTKGMYACIIGLFSDPVNPVRYQRIAISSQFKDSPRMLQEFKQYQEQLKSEGFSGLGLKPKPHPNGSKFVGSETCGDCHTTAYEIWKDSPHVKATNSIVTPPNERGAIPRHFDPECVSCHVTGWEPQRFEPYESGFWSLEETPHLVGSGCENCHGPGADHVQAENGEVSAVGEELKALVNKLRERMKLPLVNGQESAGQQSPAREKCFTCHDLDNSPEFDFEKYWERVKHVGKD